MATSLNFTFISLVLTSTAHVCVAVSSIQRVDPLAAASPGDPDTAVVTLLDGSTLNCANTYDALTTLLEMVVVG